MITHLILDWSGTLCDDQKVTCELTNKTLAHVGGQPVTPEVYARDFVIPVAGFYEKYAPGVSMTTIDQAFYGFYAKLGPALPLYPGVTELLDYTRTQEMQVYICSTLATAVLEKALAHHGLLDHVAGVWGGAADKCVVLPQKIKSLGVSGDQTLFVGDMPHDLKAGRTAQVRTGAACYGYTSAETLKEHPHDISFSTCRDILTYLQNKKEEQTAKRVVATVGGLVENPKGEVLLIQTDKWRGKWGTPGGKMEYGETMEAAFAREIKEETGLSVFDITWVCVQDCVENPEFHEPRHFLLINYKAKTENTHVVLNYESRQHCWVTPQDALALDLNTPTRVLVKEAYGL